MNDEQPRQLRRSSGDRVVLGVAGGLGDYFGVDPVIFRIGFALSIFFGGLGLLAYALLAIFVPTDGEPDRAQRLGGRLSSLGIWRGLGLVALAVLALAGLFALAGAAAFAVAVGWGVPLAVVTIVLGAILVAAAFRGGARWLVLPAVFLAVGGGTAVAADLDFQGGVGERTYHPVDAASIPSGGYRLGVGQLRIDLRDIDWTKTRVLPLKVDLGAGQAEVFVPSRVCVTGHSHVGAGEGQVAGQQFDGLDAEHTDRSAATPRLELDADVQFGQLRVVNSDTADIDTPGAGPGPFHDDLAPQREAAARACATG
jgi:phage shock protein PspC (stress-responsive transcriptional regulator)